MDLESLRKECPYVPGYNNFCKIIRILEREQVLEGYRNPYDRKKYVYLSSFGEGQLSNKENPTAVSKDTLIHDIKVSEIAKAFLSRGWASEVELEHQLHDKRNFKVTYKIIPDALLRGERKGGKFNMALEVELTRKNNQRIIEKARQYLYSSYYHYVLYFFSKKNFMQQYLELFEEKLGKEALGRFMFFVDEALTGRATELELVEGVFKGKKIKMGELFLK
ncbi:MAG: hypothetical protein HYV97_16660 [Bdellovibrio sp.]|nr:hypothetical protein [Bdellovibrio sp.]